MTTLLRPVGRSTLTVPALGLGTWPLGGPWTFAGRPAGWGPVDRSEAVRALRVGLDLGIRFIDTADVYGCGTAERLVGQAIAGRREQVIVATKAGLVFDEDTRAGAGADTSPTYLRGALTASLARLGTDYVDVFQLHAGADTAGQADDVIAVFEGLVTEGLIRWHGTSVTQPAVVDRFATAPHAVTVEHTFNVLERDTDALLAARRGHLTSLARSPLAMGLLSGRYNLQNLPVPDDVRRHTPHWTYFRLDAMSTWLDRIDRIRDLLMSDGRSLVQGALGYLWGADPSVIAIPGVRTADQVSELATAMLQQPLTPQTVATIDRLLGAATEDDD